MIVALDSTTALSTFRLRLGSAPHTHPVGITAGGTCRTATPAGCASQEVAQRAVGGVASEGGLCGAAPL